MAFVVEDGTGLEGSNSYVEVVYADEYFTVRGIATWLDATNSAKLAALVAGSDYATTRWSPLLRGRIEYSSQAMAFPRVGCYDVSGRYVTGIPEDWKKAVCEYALQAINDALHPTISAAESSRAIASKSVTVGPIKTSTSYQQGGVGMNYIRFPKADNLARRFTAQSTGVIR